MVPTGVNACLRMIPSPMTLASLYLRELKWAGVSHPANSELINSPWFCKLELMNRVKSNCITGSFQYENQELLATICPFLWRGYVFIGLNKTSNLERSREDTYTDS